MVFPFVDMGLDDIQTTAVKKTFVATRSQRDGLPPRQHVHPLTGLAGCSEQEVSIGFERVAHLADEGFLRSFRQQEQQSDGEDGVERAAEKTRVLHRLARPRRIRQPSVERCDQCRRCIDAGDTAPEPVQFHGNGLARPAAEVQHPGSGWKLRRPSLDRAESDRRCTAPRSEGLGHLFVSAGVIGAGRHGMRLITHGSVAGLKSSAQRLWRCRSQHPTSGAMPWFALSRAPGAPARTQRWPLLQRWRWLKG